MRKFKQTKQDFMKKNYLTCKYCGYNNERARFLQYGVCLKCGKILDERTYFKIQMMKRIYDNKRRQG